MDKHVVLLGENKDAPAAHAASIGCITNAHRFSAIIIDDRRVACPCFAAQTHLCAYKVAPWTAKLKRETRAGGRAWWAASGCLLTYDSSVDRFFSGLDVLASDKRRRQPFYIFLRQASHPACLSCTLALTTPRRKAHCSPLVPGPNMRMSALQLPVRGDSAYRMRTGTSQK